MGDMADMLIDQMIDEMCDPHGKVECYNIDPTATCKYCKKNPLYWEKTDVGWRLFTMSGQQHSCKEYWDGKL